MAIVHIPNSLLHLTSGRSTLEADGKTVQDALLEVAKIYPRFLDPSHVAKGQLPVFFNVRVNQKDIRLLQGLQTPVSAKAEIHFIMPLAGG